MPHPIPWYSSGLLIRLDHAECLLQAYGAVKTLIDRTRLWHNSTQASKATLDPSAFRGPYRLADLWQSQHHDGHTRYAIKMN